MEDNLVVQYFVKGGWIMWPLLVTSFTAAMVILERLLWWSEETRRFDPDRLNRVYEALGKGNVSAASDLAQTSADPILRVIWQGLNNENNSVESALQSAAGVELGRAGRYLVIIDTIVTLAPLMGLLGTVTGLMRAFFKLGSTELSTEAITGGIAEALIATACGLTIAVICLVALNAFAARLTKFQFQLQNACSNTTVLLKAAKAGITVPPPTKPNGSTPRSAPPASADETQLAPAT
jgi:biopolymer transport protein ExbB